MPGHLFTEYFLTEGIRSTDEWQASVSDAEPFDAFRDGVRQHYEALSRSADPNEAVTEQELIRPVLELLGWADYLPNRGRRATRTSRTCCCSRTLPRRSGQPREASPRRDTGTPSWSRRASGSALPSTPGTVRTGAGPGRLTARY